MKLWIEINGAHLIFLALLHCWMPGYLGWKEELKSSSLLTQQILYIHTFFIALTVGLMGLLCLICANDLLYTKLGKITLVGLFIFWLCRLYLQFFGYSSTLWRGKRFETIIHYSSALFWFNLTACFGLAAGWS